MSTPTQAEVEALGVKYLTALNEYHARHDAADKAVRLATEELAVQKSLRGNIAPQSVANARDAYLDAVRALRDAA